MNGRRDTDAQPARPEGTRGSLPLQDRFVAEADALLPDRSFDVHSLARSHLRFQFHPAGIVDVLDGLAG